MTVSQAYSRTLGLSKHQCILFIETKKGGPNVKPHRTPQNLEKFRFIALKQNCLMSVVQAILNPSMFLIMNTYHFQFFK